MTTDPQDIRLICGGALEVLAGIPTGSVDAAAFDPPYKTISGGSNDKKGGPHSRPSGILTKNDGKIFDYNDILPSAYLPEVHRVLRPNAHLYIMTNVMNLVKKDILGDLKRAGFEVHNLLFWRKNNATPNRWYMKDTELTILARKGKAFCINNPGTRSTESVEPNEWDDPTIWDDLGHEDFPFALDWDNVSSPKSHPTEKPINLMLTYIENSTQPGEVVLDCFMGSGATGVACQQAGRKFIGIELDPKYAGAASRRMLIDLEEAPSAELDIDELLGPSPSAESLLE